MTKFVIGALIVGLTTGSLGAMSPQEIVDHYAHLVKSYQASPLIRACIDDRQEEAIHMIKYHNINQQEPRFGTITCLYEFKESPTLCSGAGEMTNEQQLSLTISKRRSGYTPLHYSITNKMYVLFAKLLHESAINPNLQDADGNTPLHHAVLQMAPMYVYDLAQHARCNPYLANHRQQTPIALAYQLKDTATHAKTADDLRVIINILNTAMDKTTYTDNPFVSEDSLQLELTHTQNEA